MNIRRLRIFRGFEELYPNGPLIRVHTKDVRETTESLDNIYKKMILPPVFRKESAPIGNSRLRSMNGLMTKGDDNLYYSSYIKFRKPGDVLISSYNRLINFVIEEQFSSRRIYLNQDKTIYSVLENISFEYPSVKIDGQVVRLFPFYCRLMGIGYDADIFASFRVYAIINGQTILYYKVKHKVGKFPVMIGSELDNLEIYYAEQVKILERIGHRIRNAENLDELKDVPQTFLYPEDKILSEQISEYISLLDLGSFPEPRLLYKPEPEVRDEVTEEISPEYQDEPQFERINPLYELHQQINLEQSLDKSVILRNLKSYAKDLPSLDLSDTDYIRGKINTSVGEQEFNPGGYFIQKGSMRVIPYQDKLRTSQITTTINNKTGNLECKMTCYSPLGTSVVKISVGKVMNVQLRFMLKREYEFNILSIFKILDPGIDEPYDYLSNIAKHLTEVEFKKFQDIIALTEIGLVSYTDDNIKDILGDKYIQQSIDKINNDLFPHLDYSTHYSDKSKDERIYAKFDTLCFMIAKFIKAHVGSVKIQSKDDWSIKRLVSASKILEQLIGKLLSMYNEKIYEEIGNQRYSTHLNNILSGKAWPSDAELRIYEDYRLSLGSNPRLRSSRQLDVANEISIFHQTGISPEYTQQTSDKNIISSTDRSYKLYPQQLADKIIYGESLSSDELKIYGEYMNIIGSYSQTPSQQLINNILDKIIYGESLSSDELRIYEDYSEEVLLNLNLSRISSSQTPNTPVYLQSYPHDLITNIADKINAREQAEESIKIIRGLYTNIYRLDKDIVRSFVSGRWGISKHDTISGVVEQLNIESYSSTLANLNKIMSGINRESKSYDARKVIFNQFGIVCPEEGPEGKSLGFVKYLSLVCNVSDSRNFDTILKKSKIKFRDTRQIRISTTERDERWLTGTGEIQSGISEGFQDEDQWLTGTRETQSSIPSDIGDDENLDVPLVINGILVGWTAEQSYNKLRKMKFTREYYDISVVYTDAIYLYTDSGRPVRPTLRISDGQPIANSHDETDVWKLLLIEAVEFLDPLEIDNHWKVAPSIRYIDGIKERLKNAEESLILSRNKRNEYLSRVFPQNDVSKLSTILKKSEGIMSKPENERISREILETIQENLRNKFDVIEFAKILRGISYEVIIIQDLAKQSVYTHVELGPSYMFGSSAAITPRNDCNVGPRNTFQAGMIKQSLCIVKNPSSITHDPTTRIYVYPSHPTFVNSAYYLLNIDKYPGGENRIVAINTGGGYNEEDSIIIRQGSDPYFCVVKIVSAEATYKDVSGDRNSIITIGKPVSSSGNTRHLNDNGIPPIGFFLRPGGSNRSPDAIIGQIKNNPNEQPLDASIYCDESNTGIVDRIIITKGKKGQPVVKIWILQYFRATYGDKFEMRYSQKGVVGTVMRPEDMPYSDDGTIPDIIFNPLGLITRMTMGLIMELTLNTYSLITGRSFCSDPFIPVDMGDVIKILREFGFDQWNLSNLTGKDGRRIKHQICMGPIDYHMLRHIASLKYQITGQSAKIDTITKQPVKRNGIRIGEHEVIQLLAHAAMGNLNERMGLLSDLGMFPVCTRCDCDLQFVEDKYVCPTCDDTESQALFVHPYSSSVLRDIFRCMGINMDFKYENV